MTLVIAAALLLTTQVAGAQEPSREPYEDQINWGRRIERPDLTPRLLSIEGQDFARDCHISRRKPPLRCTIYVAATADQLVITREICPTTGAILVPDLVETVRDYLRRRPDAARQHGSAIVKAALSDRYPCVR